MVLNLIILFMAAMIGGTAYFLFPKLQQRQFSGILVFAGSYLFAITIVHILPEVYSVYPYYTRIGGFVLLGFFMQLGLESLSSGVEHGHIPDGHDIKRSGKMTSPWMLLLGLCLHSILEGTIVASPVGNPGHHHAEGVLLGIVIHKIPAAFALMTILVYFTGKKKLAVILLIIFALASPFGLAMSEWFSAMDVLNVEGQAILFAVVSGSFLNISTTIFFEANPDHRFSFKKAIISLFGVGTAVIFEIFL